MKNISIIISLLLLFTMCSDDQQKVDTRLDGLEVEFSHVDPRTSEIIKNTFNQSYLEAENDIVNITIESKNKKIKKVDVVSTVGQKVLKTIDGNDKVNFTMPFNDLGVNLGQRDDLRFHIYFDDETGDFNYPSIKSYTFAATSYLEPLTYIKKQDGTEIPLTTKEFDITRFYINEGKGVTVEFTEGKPSFLRIDPTTDLDFIRKSNFSVTFWLNMVDDYTNDPALISTQDWANKNSNGFTITPRRDHGLAMTFGRGYSKIALENSRPYIQPGEWVFITAVVDRSGLAKLYQNAEKKEEKSIAAASSVDLIGDAQITINQDAKGAFKDKPHSEFSQVFFYDYLLTDEQVKEIYDRTK